MLNTARLSLSALASPAVKTACVEPFILLVLYIQKAEGLKLFVVLFC